MAVPQKLHPTGHKEPSNTADVHEQRTKSFPKDDANANKTFFGPAGLLKGAGSGRNKTMLNLNVRPIQDASKFQKARRK